ncbi:MAG: hypothetical protein ACE5D4_09740 [Thermodesulfobacteriota bacterium]
MQYRKKSDLRKKKFRCTRVLHGLGSNEIPAMREALQKHVADLDELEMEETENSFGLSDGRFIMKPKLPKVTEGVLDCTRTFALFEDVRIEYREMKKFRDGTFETDLAKYVIIGEVKGPILDIIECEWCDQKFRPKEDDETTCSEKCEDSVVGLNKA